MSTITTLTAAELDAVNGAWGGYTSYYKSPNIQTAIGGNGGAGGVAISGASSGNTLFGKSVAVATFTGDASANGGNGSISVSNG